MQDTCTRWRPTARARLFYKRPTTAKMDHWQWRRDPTAQKYGYIPVPVLWRRSPSSDALRLPASPGAHVGGLSWDAHSGLMCCRRIFWTLSCTTCKSQNYYRLRSIAIPDFFYYPPPPLSRVYRLVDYRQRDFEMIDIMLCICERLRCWTACII